MCAGSEYDRLSHIADQLDKASLRRLTITATIKRDALPWEHQEDQARQDLEAVASEIRDLTAQLRTAQRLALARVLDIAETVPEDRENWRQLREVLLGLRVILRVEEHFL